MAFWLMERANNERQLLAPATVSVYYRVCNTTNDSEWRAILHGDIVGEIKHFFSLLNVGMNGMSGYIYKAQYSGFCSSFVENERKTLKQSSIVVVMTLSI